MPEHDPREQPSTRHFVQFYQSLDILIDSVSGFIGAGLKTGEGALVIARAEYRRLLEARLARMGVNVARARTSGQFIAVDAAETLGRFMNDSWPSETQFDAAIRPLLQHVGRDGRPVRAFGEMVALLWEAGKLSAAIRIEQFWETLTKASGGSVSLFCAYPVSDVHGAILDAALTQVCRKHSAVIPAEDYTHLEGEQDRVRAIVLLQQKARALEAEIARRKELEFALYCRERELAQLFDHGVESLLKLAPDGTILWANQAELDLLGYEAEEYVGHNIAQFHVDPSAAVHVLERLLRRETILNHTARLRCKDSSIKEIVIRAHGVWESGRLAHARCFTRETGGRPSAPAAARKRLPSSAPAAEVRNETAAAS